MLDKSCAGAAIQLQGILYMALLISKLIVAKVQHSAQSINPERKIEFPVTCRPTGSMGAHFASQLFCSAH